MKPDQERRVRKFRRDLNDLVRGPDGRVSEAKTWGNVGKFIAAYLLLHHTEYIVDRPDAMFLLFSFLILPDMAKKILDAKYPHPTTVASAPKAPG